MDGGNDLINVSSCIKHIASIFILFINLDEVGLSMDRKYKKFQNEYDIVTKLPTHSSKSDSNARLRFFFLRHRVVFNVDTE